MGGASAPRGLSERDRAAIRQMFAGARRDVEVAVYRRGSITEAATGFLRALADVQTLSRRIRVSMHEYTDREQVVERDPGIALLGGDGTDLRVRFYGWPSGYEFNAFLTTVADAVSGEQAQQLQPETLQALAGLRNDVQIKVFATPT